MDCFDHMITNRKVREIFLSFDQKFDLLTFYFSKLLAGIPNYSSIKVCEWVADLCRHGTVPSFIYVLSRIHKYSHTSILIKK